MKLDAELLSYYSEIETKNVLNERHCPRQLQEMILRATISDITKLPPVEFPLNSFMGEIDSLEAGLNRDAGVKFLKVIQKQADSEAYKIFYSVAYLYIILRLDNTPYREFLVSKCRMFMALLTTPVDCTAPLSCGLI